MAKLVVTDMEMTRPPVGERLLRPLPEARITRKTMAPEPYLALWRAVGEPLQWDGRLQLAPAELNRILADPATYLYTLVLNGSAVGLCEFAGVGHASVELTYFGLIPQAQGKRLGPYLLDYALREIWLHAPSRVWLRTDSEDHPKAIGTYERAGFVIRRQRVVDEESTTQP